MTDEQIVAQLRSVRQQAAALLATTDALLQMLSPPPQEPPKRKARYLGDDTSQPANGQVTDG